MTTIATAIPLSDQVTDVQLTKYADLIYKVTGIRISPQKKSLLSNRIRRRLKVTGIKDFEAYFNAIRTLDVNDDEWVAFVQEITTHETYLFRDEVQWDWFRNTFLDEIAAAARRGERERELRIWSAACSTGDECYTIASCIAAVMPNYSQWKIEILGTDIGIVALEKAKQATFGERAMRLVPPSYNRRFFTKHDGADPTWTAKAILSDMITFRRHNLMEPLRVVPFDLVLVKNVLIYFDAPSKKTVLGHVRKLVRPGGLLLAGAAEGVSELLGDLERDQAWLFRQP
jgi:chemotaxis protein methyltransferase CheR